MSDAYETPLAPTIARLICKNVDLFYTDVITYERFASRNVRLWNCAQLNACARKVTAILANIAKEEKREAEIC